MFALKSRKTHKIPIVCICMVLATFILSASACQAPQATPTQAPPNPPTQTPAASQPSATPPAQTPAGSSTGKAGWVADGVISPGEYQNSKSFGDYTINWSNDDQFVYIGVQAKTMGWVAVGFGATTFMKDANIVQCYFSDGKAVVADQFSTGTFGPHSDVTSMGGTSAILDSGGTQANGTTIVEFKRKLAPGDKFHPALIKGSNNIIWAYGGDNNWVIKHISRGEGQIIIQ